MRLSSTIRASRRISLTPLIDVVFLLLIFFMLSSTFLKFTSLDVAGGKSSAGHSDISSLVLVRVHKEGTIDVNGQVVLIENLQAHLAALPIAGKMKIAVKALDGSTVQNIVDAIEKMRAEQPRDVFIVN